MGGPRRNYIQKSTGKKQPGVTTIAGILNKPALIWWGYKQGLDNYERLSSTIAELAKGNGQEITTDRLQGLISDFHVLGLYDKRDEAADAGTLAHEFVENHLRGLPDPKTEGLPKAVIEKAEGCYLTFLDWEKTHELEVIDSEVGLTSEVMPFGGTIDHVIRTATLKREPQAVEILDIKTGKGIYLEAKIQVGTYKMLWQEHHPDRPVRGLHILRLGPNGEFTHEFFPDLDGYVPIFKDCCNIYHQIKSLGEKL